MDLTKVSKFISLILRHKPEEIGITLDEHGWADTIALVEGVAKKYPGFKVSTLIDIVKNDEKQRYTFTPNFARIRANQGHSIPVDVELETLTPPEYLYHGTAEKYTLSIENNGIISKSRLYVHLSEDVTTAINVGSRHGNAAVYRVDTKAMTDAGFIFKRSLNGVWLVERVPVWAIERIV